MKEVVYTIWSGRVIRKVYAKMKDQRGECNGKNKYKWKQIKLWRMLHYEFGWHYKKIAKVFCCSEGYMYRIVNYKIWKYGS